MARGIKKCQDKSSKFPNFIRIRLLIRLIRSERIQSEFAHACLMSSLFIFRVPSESLQLRRSFRNDRLLEFPPHADKAMIGIRSVGDQGFLAVKMAFRKNLTGGVIVKRPCFCGLQNALALRTRPAHYLRPAIKARVPPGARLFVEVNRRNFNRRLKALLARLGAARK